MIRITIELQKAGTVLTTQETEVLGRLFIWNRGKAAAAKLRPGRHHYSFALARKGSPEPEFAMAPKPEHTTFTGSVDDYPSQTYTIWKLVYRALQQALIS